MSKQTYDNFTEYTIDGVTFKLSKADWELLKVSDEVKTYCDPSDGMGYDLQGKVNGYWVLISNETPYWEFLNPDIPL